MRAYPTCGDEIRQIRRISLDVDPSKLRINNTGYDHRFAKEDHNANLPLDRLSELVEDGTLGSLAEETLVLMGLQPNVGPLIRETVPEVVASFKADDVEAALLVPSGPVCHQTESLSARGLEEAGIPTALVSDMPGLSRVARPARHVMRRRKSGAAGGRRPADRSLRALH